MSVFGLPVLEVNKFSAWYGASRALFDVDLQVQQGELVVLQGLNGAGKSSLLAALMGLNPQTAGSVVFAGVDVTQWPAHERALAGMGYVPEDRRLFTSLTVEENLMIAARDAVKEADRGVQQRREYVLDLFPALQSMLKRQAFRMSGGEQQMLSIARTLMTSPSFVLLDEPCEGIAPVLVESIRDALLDLRSRGTTMLVAEQNAVLARRADRVITLEAGQIVRQSTP